MNSTFKATAFSPDEQLLIPVTKVSNPNNSITRANGGATTNDYLFLLSLDEIETYFYSASSRPVYATRYLIKNKTAKGPYIDDNNHANWWLRTPGRDNHYAACIGNDGTLGDGGYQVNNTLLVVRPAMWIDTSSIK